MNKKSLITALIAGLITVPALARDRSMNCTSIQMEYPESGRVMVIQNRTQARYVITGRTLRVGSSSYQFDRVETVKGVRYDRYISRSEGATKMIAQGSNPDVYDIRRNPWGELAVGVIECRG